MDLDMSLDDLVAVGAGGGGRPQSGRSWKRPEPYGRSGSKPQGGRKSSLVDAVREAQRSSYKFVQAWRDFCDSNGTGDYDPSRYDEDFLRGALEELGASSAQSSGYGKSGGGRRGSWTEGGGDWKRKRAEDDGGDWSKESWHGSQSSAVMQKRGVGQGGGMAGSAAHTRLVESVKQWQRSDKRNGDAWRGLCDERGDGSYDPSKYGAAFLKKALQELAPGAVSRGGDGGGGAWGEPDLAESVREWQRSSLVHTLAWRQYCDERGGNGSYDPGRYDAVFLRKAIATLEIDGAPSASGTAGHGSLVEEIKTWQRESSANTAAWREYCDDMGDGHYDPSRHEASFLQAALEQLAGRTPRRAAGAGGRRPSQGGSDGGWGGGRSGGRGDGGQQGGGAAGSGPLTSRVKELQRSSIQGTKAWREYCSAEGDGSFDPAHYDAGFLRAWLAKMEEETW